MTEPTSILVTGGAGYIGSHACKALRKAGFKPVVYDNLCRGHRWAVRWGPLVEADLLDEKALDETFKRYKPSAVLHFAGLGYVSESVEQPATYYRSNITGTLNLVEAMLRNKVTSMVFSSSCAIYGAARDNAAVCEKSEQKPMSPYGRSKWMAEQILRDCGVAHGLQSVCLRYFNVAGSDPDLEIGENHEPETHVIPNLLRTAAGLNPVFVINGRDHATPDGTCIRDYTHVTDLAEAHVLALKAMFQGRALPAYNLGNGRGYSVLELISAAERVTGRPIRLKSAAARAGDPPSAVADAQLAREHLAWHPKFGDVDTMMRTAWSWMQKVSTMAPMLESVGQPVDVL